MSFGYVKSFNVWSDPDLGHRHKLKCFSPSKSVCFRHTRVMTQAGREGRGVGHALEELSQISLAIRSTKSACQNGVGGDESAQHVRLQPQVPLFR